MNNIEILANAFEFIEKNLTNEIKTQDVADACYCSKSVLDKVFRFAGKIPVHEYIVRRRMMLAGRMILSGKNKTLLEIALHLAIAHMNHLQEHSKRCGTASLQNSRTENHIMNYSQDFIRIYQEVRIWVKEKKLI